MKLVTLAVLLAPLSACHTQPAQGREIEAQPATSETTMVLDFSGLREQSMTVEEFVKACQRVSGFNFTYTESTQAAMNAKSMRILGSDQVAVTEFGSFLNAQLQDSGFTCERIGPDHLRVFSIQPRAM